MFKLLKLEDRIVLDGAAIGDLMDEAQAHDQREDMLQEMAQARDGDSPDGDGADGDAHDFDTHEPLFIDDGFMEDAPDSQEADGVRVLVISSELEDGDDLASAVKDGVIVVEYDAEKTGLDDLAKLIDEALGDQKADSIAFASHNSGDGEIQLTQPDRLSAPEYQDFWKQIGELVEDGGRIDLLACNVVEDAEGERFLSSLEEYSGTNVAASTDKTGNEAYGGDWVLEEPDGVDVQDSYFDAEKLERFEGLLDGDPPDSNIPDFGGVPTQRVYVDFHPSVFADLGTGLTYEGDIDSDISQMRFYPSYRIFYGYLPGTADTTYEMSVTATNADGDSRTSEFEIVVPASGESIPSYSNPPIQYTNPDAAYQVDAWDTDWSRTPAAATDPDGGDLTYSLVGGNLDNTFKMDPASGEISINNPAGLSYAENPYFVLSAQVNDPQGNVDRALISIRLTENVEPADLKTVTIGAPDVSNLDEDAQESATMSVVVGDGGFSVDRTVELSYTGDADLNADYEVRDADGNTLPVNTDGNLELNFNADVTEQTITVKALDDTESEPAEDIQLDLVSLPTDYLVGTPGNQTVTINASDAPPTATLQVVGSSSFAEDGSAYVRVNLSEAPTSNTVVYVDFTDIADANDPGTDFLFRQDGSLLTPNGDGYLPVIINTGETFADIELDGIDDAPQTPAEGPEEISLSLQTGDGYQVGADSQETVTLTDNDGIPVITLEMADGSTISEGESSTILVNLSHPAPSGFVLHLNYSTDGAGLNEDYELYEPGPLKISDPDGDGHVTLDIAAGEQSFDIQIDALLDGVAEGDELFTLSVDDSAVTDYQAGDPAAQNLTIVDTEITQKPTIFLSVNEADFAEDSGSAEILAAMISGSAQDDIEVQLKFETDSTFQAFFGKDYTGPTSVTIEAGNDFGTMLIDGMTDTEIEGDELYKVSLETSPFYELHTDPDKLSVTGTVVDTSDPTVWLEGDGNIFNETDTGKVGSVLTLNLNETNDVQTTVTLSFSGEATPGADYDLDGWTINKGKANVIIPIGQDSLDMDIYPLDDLVYEAGNETIQVDISSAVNAYVTGDTALTQATAEIVDNESPPELSLSLSNYTFNEEGANTSTTLSVQLSDLNDLSDDVVVYLEAAGDANYSADFNDLPGDDAVYNVSDARWEVTIGSGLKVGNLYLGGLSDDLVEGNEPFTLKVAEVTPTDGAIWDADDQVTATVMESSPAPAVNLDISTDTIYEDISADVRETTISVSLDATMDITGTVYLNLGDDAETADYTVSVGGTSQDIGSGQVAVQFAPGETLQNVVVQVADDAIYEGTELLEVDIASDDFNSSNITDSVTAQIIDDETMPTDPRVNLQALEDPLEIDEHSGDGNQTAGIMVALTDAIDKDTTVTLSLAGAAGTDDYTLSVDGSDLNLDAGEATVVVPAGETGQMVVISGVPDSEFEYQESFDIQISNVTDDYGYFDEGSDTQVTGIINDQLDQNYVSLAPLSGTGPFMENNPSGYWYAVKLDQKANEDVTVSLTVDPSYDANPGTRNDPGTLANPKEAYPEEVDGDGGDYSMDTLVVIPAGAQGVNVNVVPEDDLRYEGWETFDIQIDSDITGDGVAPALDNTDLQLTIQDDETATSPPVVRVYLNDEDLTAEVQEPQAGSYNDAALVVELDGAYSEDVTVNLQVSGNATYDDPGMDYQILGTDGQAISLGDQSGTFDVVIPTGQESVTLTLEALDDTFYEGGDTGAREEVTVKFLDIPSDNATYEQDDGVTAFIQDGDGTPELKLDIVNQNDLFYENPTAVGVTDGSQKLTISLSLDTAWEEDIYVNLKSYTDADATATDYVYERGFQELDKILVPAGTTEVTSVILRATDDTNYEGAESVILSIDSIEDKNGDPIPEVDYEVTGDQHTAYIVDSNPPDVSLDVTDLDGNDFTGASFSEDGSASDGNRVTGAISLEDPAEGEVTVTLAFDKGEAYGKPGPTDQTSLGSVDNAHASDYNVDTAAGYIQDSEWRKEGDYFLYDFVFTDTQETVTFDLRGVPDGATEGDEVFNIFIKDAVGASISAQDTATLTLIDEDYVRPEVELKLVNVMGQAKDLFEDFYESATEAFQRYDLVVFLSDGQIVPENLEVDVDLKFNISDAANDAHWWDDYVIYEQGTTNTVSVGSQGNYGTVSVQIPDGQNQLVLELSPIDDDVFEGDEDIRVSIDAVTNGLNDVPAAGEDDVTLVLVDNETLPTVRIAFSDMNQSASFDESAGEASFMVYMDGGAVGTDTTVRLEFSSGDVTGQMAHAFNDGDQKDDADWTAADYEVAVMDGTDGKVLDDASMGASPAEGPFTYDVVIPEGETAVRFDLVGLDDGRFEGDESFDVTVLSATADIAGVGVTDLIDSNYSEISGTIIENELKPEISMEFSDGDDMYEVTENDTDMQVATINLSLSAPTFSDLDFKLNFANVAEAWSDGGDKFSDNDFIVYTDASLNASDAISVTTDGELDLTFDEGQTELTLYLGVTADSIYEKPFEDSVITITTDFNADLAANTDADELTFRIYDDTDEAPEVYLHWDVSDTTVDTYQATEGDLGVKLYASLEYKVGADTKVSLSFDDVTGDLAEALLGTDYDVSNQYVVIPEGLLSNYIFLDFMDDDIRENNETVALGTVGGEKFEVSIDDVKIGAQSVAVSDTATGEIYDGPGGTEDKPEIWLDFDSDAFTDIFKEGNTDGISLFLNISGDRKVPLSLDIQFTDETPPGHDLEYGIDENFYLATVDSDGNPDVYLTDSGFVDGLVTVTVGAEDGEVVELRLIGVTDGNYDFSTDVDPIEIIIENTVQNAVTASQYQPLTATLIEGDDGPQVSLGFWDPWSGTDGQQVSDYEVDEPAFTSGVSPTDNTNQDYVGMKLSLVEPDGDSWTANNPEKITVELDFDGASEGVGEDYQVILFTTADGGDPHTDVPADVLDFTEGKARVTFTAGTAGFGTTEIYLALVPENNESYVGPREVTAKAADIVSDNATVHTDSDEVTATILEDESAPNVDIFFRSTVDGTTHDTFSFAEKGGLVEVVGVAYGQTYSEDITVNLSFAGDAEFTFSSLGQDYFPADGNDFLIIENSQPGVTESSGYLLFAGDDSVHEANETFTVTVTDGDGYTVDGGTNVITGTIMDDDPGPTVGIELIQTSGTDDTLPENGGWGTLKVYFTDGGDGIADSQIEETVKLKLGGDAGASVTDSGDGVTADYSLLYDDTDGVTHTPYYVGDQAYLDVIFKPGQTQVDIDLKAINDQDPNRAYEEPEVVEVDIYSYGSFLRPENPEAITTDRVYATIIDDDADLAPKVYLEMDTPSGSEYTFDEDTEAATLNVVMDRDTPSEVTLTLKLSGDADYAGSTAPADVKNQGAIDYFMSTDDTPGGMDGVTDFEAPDIGYYMDSATGDLKYLATDDVSFNTQNGELTLTIPANAYADNGGRGVFITMTGRSDDLYELSEEINVQIDGDSVRNALPATYNQMATATIVDETDNPTVEIKTDWTDSGGPVFNETGDTSTNDNEGAVDETDEDYTISLTVYRDGNALQSRDVYWNVEPAAGTDAAEEEDYEVLSDDSVPLRLGYDGSAGENVDIRINGDNVDEENDTDKLVLKLYNSASDRDDGVNVQKSFELSIQDQYTDMFHAFDYWTDAQLYGTHDLDYQIGMQMDSDDTPSADVGDPPDFHVSDSELDENGSYKLSTDDLFFIDADGVTDQNSADDVDESGLGIRYIISEPPQHGWLYLEQGGATDSFDEGVDTLLNTGDQFDQNDIIQERVWYEPFNAGQTHDSFLFSVADDVNVSTGPEFGQSFNNDMVAGTTDIAEGDRWEFNFFIKDTQDAPEMETDHLILYVQENVPNSPAYFDQALTGDEALLAWDNDLGDSLLPDSTIVSVNGETDGDLVNNYFELYAIDGDDSQLGLRVTKPGGLDHENFDYVIEIQASDGTDGSTPQEYYLYVVDQPEAPDYPVNPFTGQIEIISSQDYVSTDAEINLDAIFPQEADYYYYTARDQSNNDVTTEVAQWFKFDTYNERFWYDNANDPDYVGNRVFDITLHAVYYDFDGSGQVTPTVVDTPQPFELLYVASLDMDLMNAPDAELMDALEYLEGDDDGILPAEGEDGLPVNDVMVADAPAEAPVEGLENKSEFDEVLALLDGDGLDTTADLMEMQEIIVAEDINRKLDSDRA